MLIFASSSSSSANNTIPLILGEFQGPRWKNAQQTVASKILLENKWVSVAEHTVKLHNNDTIDDWLWIDVNHQINVLVSTLDANGDERFWIFKQTKYGYNGLSYAVVGGHIDGQELPLSAAKRELMEEMGMHSNKWLFLGKYRTDVNRGIGWCYSYIARHSKQIKDMKNKYADETEEMELIVVDINQILDYYKNGYFQEAKWSNTVGLALMHVLSAK